MENLMKNPNMDAYEILQVHILYQAIKDYRNALKKKKPAQIAELEKFFRSPYGQLLSGDKGEYIIEKVKEQLEEERRRKRRNGNKTNR